MSTIKKFSVVNILILWLLSTSFAVFGAEADQLNTVRVISFEPDPKVISELDTRQDINATGLPWHILHVESGVEFLLVPSGEYLQGAASDDPFANRQNEYPQHRVIIPEPFYLGKFEVTNKQMRSFRAEHSSGEFYRDENIDLDGDDQPAVDISWDDAKAYTAHFELLLPSEAEWEYAARSGVLTRYPWGNDLKAGQGWGNLFNPSMVKRLDMNWDAFPWEDGFDGSAPVGSFKPNEWGFYDMVGNVWEWVEDDFFDDAYEHITAKSVNPEPGKSETHTLRGGGYGNAPRASSLPYRFGMGHDVKHDANGFRVVLPINMIKIE